jgi:hypothetical protein
MTPAQHARLSPSGAERWVACPASVSMEAGLPETESDYARYGTAAHELAAQCLVDNRIPLDYLDCTMSNGVKVDTEMVEAVQDYLYHVRTLAGDVPIMVEQKLDLRDWIPEGFGTADAVIVRGDELIVCDLKMGRGVQVNAFENKQLILYALGAYALFSLIQPIKRICCVIIQPRLDHLDKWACDTDTLLQHGERLATAAGRAWHFTNDAQPASEDFGPSQTACRFCRARGQCPAQTQFVLNTIADDFVDLTRPLDPVLETAKERIRCSDNAHIASLLPHLDMIEDWSRAVRARAESELLAGNPLPGYKLVEGRRSARKWRNLEEAENILKSMKLKHAQMYERKLISPTCAEKQLKKDAPHRWERLLPLITQTEGKPCIVPEADPRTALLSTQDAVLNDFEILEAA